MSEPTDILGKAGKIVGEKIKLKLDKAGGTMTGSLVLSGAPGADLEAASKKYVDDSVGAINVNQVTGNLDVSGDVTCANLTVTGDTTTLNVQTVEVEDNILLINKVAQGEAVPASSGLEIHRGGSITANVVVDVSAYTTAPQNLSGTYTYDSSTQRYVGLNGYLELNNGDWTLYDNQPYPWAYFSDGRTDPDGTMSDGVTCSYTAEQSLNPAGFKWEETNNRFEAKVGSTLVAEISAKLAAPSDGITINGVALGDYSTFEAALNAALA